MLKKDLLLLWNTLNELRYDESQKQYIKFKYMLARNKIKLKPEIDILQELLKLSPELTEFNEKRVELCKVHARKGDNEEPIIHNNNYDIIDKKAFNEAVETLKDNYKDAIQKEEKRAKELETLFDEVIDIEINKIKLEEIPGDLGQPIIDLFVKLDIIIE